MWALVEVRGTCSGGSKSQITMGRHSEHVEPSRPMQTHVQLKKMSDGSRMSCRILLTARTDCPPRACSRMLVLVLECTSCSCSSARGRAHVRARLHLVVMLACCRARACDVVNVVRYYLVMCSLAPSEIDLKSLLVSVPQQYESSRRQEEEGNHMSKTSVQQSTSNTPY